MVWLINGRRPDDAGESLLVPLIAEAVREAESLFDTQLVHDPVALLEASKEKLFQVIADASRDESDQKIVQLEQRVSMLERQGQLDSLTGVANRGYFHEELDRLFDAAVKSGHALSLMFIDADHFKVINDRFGHLAGDEVLVWLAKALQPLSRSTDLVGRYGGEEFVVILPGVSETDAKAFGQRICDHVRSSSIDVSADASIRITVSVGVASSEDSRRMRSTRDLIFAADQAMYFAKESGRDLCIGASALPVPPVDIAALG
jgi:diguanylate cyclase (GGDEF)-like protein